MEFYDTHVDEESYWSKIVSPVTYTFENYGWYILITLVVLMFVYNKKLKSYWEKYRNDKFEREYAAKYHKNPDLFEAHMHAKDRWVQKMQEQYNKESNEYQEKMKQKEEKKKQELMEKYSDHPSGHKLGTSSTSNDKPTNLRPEYNPLMGGGTSSSYRPQRRSPCGGGGCGR